MPVEEPCAKTGLGCDWLWDWDDADGSPSGDMYCIQCFRNRDWLKDEWRPGAGRGG